MKPFVLGAGSFVVFVIPEAGFDEETVVKRAQALINEEQALE